MRARVLAFPAALLAFAASWGVWRSIASLAPVTCDTSAPADGSVTLTPVRYADAGPPREFVGTYASADGGTVQAVSQQTAVVVLPSSGAGPWPTVVTVHGGGDYQGSADVLDAEMLAARGYAAVAVNYRLVATSDGGPIDGSDAGVPLENQFPASVSDVRCALRWVATNALVYGFDSSRLAIVGGSAGASLALLAASVPRDADPRWDDGTCAIGGHVPAVKLAIGFFGIYSYLEGGTISVDGGDGGGVIAQMLGAAVGTEPVSRQASAISWIGVRTPPTLLLVGDEDTVIQPSQTLDYYAALVDAGVDAGLVELATLGHAFPMFAVDASGDLETATCSALGALGAM